MEQAENQPDRRCRHCGTALTDNTTGGLCPRCLLEMNFASRTMPGGEPSPQAPPPSPEEMAARFPQFEILECLGRGGMGIVYKARQKSLDRLVAIKVLAGEMRDEPQFEVRFSREARTLAKLSHPNIVTVHDFGESDGMFYLVMEFIDGVNLRDVLQDGRMEPAQALAIVPEICAALQFAHDHGVVHRDIKPENILMDRGGRVKIADFGIATLVGARAEHSGTPPYMAPEQEAADGPIDHRADIYALGVVFYEMLTGERPEQDPSRPSGRVEIDVRIDEIVLRALEKEPARRYQTAGEFRTVVETLATPSAGRTVDADLPKPLAPNLAAEVMPATRQTKVLRVGSFLGTLAAIIAVAAIVFFVKVVPQWEDAWQQDRMEIGTGYQVLIGLSHLCQQFWPVWALLLLFLAVASVTCFVISGKRQRVSAVAAGKPKTQLRSILFHAAVIQVAWLMLACGLHLLGRDLESVHLIQGHELIGLRQFLITLTRDGWLAWSVVPGLVLVGVLMAAVGRHTGREGLWVASTFCGLPVFIIGILGVLGIRRFGGPPMALSLVAAPVWLGSAWLTAGIVSLRHAESRSGKLAWWALGLLLVVVLIVLLTLLSLPASGVALLFSFMLGTLAGLGSLVCALFTWRTRLGRGVVLGWGTAALLTALCFTIYFGMAITRHREAALVHEPAGTTPQQVARDYLAASYSGDVARALQMIAGPLGETPEEHARLIEFYQVGGDNGSEPPEIQGWHKEGAHAVASVIAPVEGRRIEVLLILERIRGTWKVVGTGLHQPDRTLEEELRIFKRFRAVDRKDRDEVASAFVRAVRSGDFALAAMLVWRPMPTDPDDLARKFSEAGWGASAADRAISFKWYEDAPYAVTRVKLADDQTEQVSCLALRHTEGIWRVVWSDTSSPDTSLSEDLKRFKHEQMAAQVIVEDLALRFVVAIREKDEEALRELCVDRTEGWTEALVGHFSMELRERFRQMTGEEFTLYPDPSAVRVDGDLAVVACLAYKEVQKKLGGSILVLYFCRTESGWKVWTVRKAPQDQPMQEHLDQARQWAAEWRDDLPSVDGIGDALNRSEEVSTLSTIVTIVLNLIPAERDVFTVEVVGDEQSIHFDRQADGSWKAILDAGRESVTYSVDGTKLTATDGGKPRTVDLARYLDIEESTDWSKLGELSFRDHSVVKIGRNPEGLELVFLPQEGIEREEHHVKVTWKVVWGETQNTPESVARAFMEALRRRDSAKAATLVDRPIKQRELDNLAAMMHQLYGADLDRLTAFTEWHHDEPHAVGTLRAPPDRPDSKLVLVLKRSGGDWKVTAGPLPSDRATPLDDELRRVLKDRERAVERVKALPVTPPVAMPEGSPLTVAQMKTILEKVTWADFIAWFADDGHEHEVSWKEVPAKGGNGSCFEVSFRFGGEKMLLDLEVEPEFRRAVPTRMRPAANPNQVMANASEFLPLMMIRYAVKSDHPAAAPAAKEVMARARQARDLSTMREYGVALAVCQEETGSLPESLQALVGKKFIRELMTMENHETGKMEPPLYHGGPELRIEEVDLTKTIVLAAPSADPAGKRIVGFLDSHVAVIDEADYQKQLKAQQRPPMERAVDAFLESCSRKGITDKEQLFKELGMAEFIAQYGDGERAMREHHDKLPAVMRFAVSKTTGEPSPEFIEYLRKVHRDSDPQLGKQADLLLRMLGGTMSHGGEEESTGTQPQPALDMLGVQVLVNPLATLAAWKVARHTQHPEKSS